MVTGNATQNNNISAHRNEIHNTKTCWRTIERQYSIFSPFVRSFFVYFFIFFSLGILEASKFNFLRSKREQASVVSVRLCMKWIKIEIRNLLDTHNLTQHNKHSVGRQQWARTRTLGRHHLSLGNLMKINTWKCSAVAGFGGSAKWFFIHIDSIIIILNTRTHTYTPTHLYTNTLLTDKRKTGVAVYTMENRKWEIISGPICSSADKCSTIFVRQKLLQKTSAPRQLVLSNL